MGWHAGAKDRLSNGIPIETVSAMLGHKNFRTTQIYAKVVQEKISKSLAETCVCLANAQGGEIIVGIEKRLADEPPKARHV